MMKASENFGKISSMVKRKRKNIRIPPKRIGTSLFWAKVILLKIDQHFTLPITQLANAKNKIRYGKKKGWIPPSFTLTQREGKKEVAFYRIK